MAKGLIRATGDDGVKSTLEAAIANARLHRSVFYADDDLIAFASAEDLAVRTEPVQLAQLHEDKFYAHIYKRDPEASAPEELKQERYKELLSILAYRATSNDYSLDRLHVVRLAIDAGTFRLTEEERATKIAEYQKLSAATFEDGLTLQERRAGIIVSGITDETLAYERSLDPADRRLMRKSGLTLRGAKHAGRGRKPKVPKTARMIIEELQLSSLYINARRRWWLLRLFKACRLVVALTSEIRDLDSYDPRDRSRELTKWRDRYHYDALFGIRDDAVRLAVAIISAKTVESGSKEYAPQLDLAARIFTCYRQYERACNILKVPLTEKHKKIKPLIFQNFCLLLSPA